MIWAALRLCHLVSDCLSDLRRVPSQLDLLFSLGLVASDPYLPNCPSVLMLAYRIYTCLGNLFIVSFMFKYGEQHCSPMARMSIGTHVHVEGCNSY